MELQIKRINLTDFIYREPFQIILHESKTVFPYVSINCDEIESNYTGTFKNVSRGKGIAHIKALCADAQSVFIYDKYISKDEVCRNALPQILPVHALTIEFCESTYRENYSWVTRDQISFSEINHLNVTQSLSWNFIKIANNDPRNQDLHDRYMIIDDKIEVILSSGFRGLVNNSKDFSYIVRKVK